MVVDYVRYLLSGTNRVVVFAYRKPGHERMGAFFIRGRKESNYLFSDQALRRGVQCEKQLRKTPPNKRSLKGLEYESNC